jgi:hypothetical protein
MNVEPVTFGGWPNCLRLANSAAELILTTEVGPRIISYRTTGGENVFKVNAPEIGGSGETEFVARGGHRLWLAPEDERTYAPDNTPVKSEILGPGSVRLSNPATAPWGIEKELTVTLQPSSSAVTVGHRLTNRGEAPARLAPWALTVMRAGGVEIVPQPPLGLHPRDLLPSRVLVPWDYTDLTDPRLRLGRKFITVRQVPGGKPAKLGLAHREKWIGYALPGALFLKTLHYVEGATYPDFGCNFETFTNSEMLEIESLGPLTDLAPGATVSLEETWHLFAPDAFPGSLEDAALSKWLAPFLSTASLS